MNYPITYQTEEGAWEHASVVDAESPEAAVWLLREMGAPHPWVSRPAAVFEPGESDGEPVLSCVLVDRP